VAGSGDRGRLPTDQQRVLRLLSLRPGQDIDAYAAGRASDEDAPPERRAALTRLFDFYLHTAYIGDRLLYPHRDPVAPAPARAAAVAVVPLTDVGAAMAWFTAEHAVLLAVAEQATEPGAASSRSPRPPRRIRRRRPE
jgi:hypothetical protein